MEISVDGMSAIAALSDKIEQAGKKAPRGVARALNRVGSKSATLVVEEAGHIFTAKPRTLRASLKIHRASPENLSSGFTSTGKKIPAAGFQHTPKSDTTGKKRKPITLEVKRGEQERLTTHFIFKKEIRVRTGRRHHTRLTVMTAPDMLGQPEVQEKLRDMVAEELPRRITHEINQILGFYS